MVTILVMYKHHQELEISGTSYPKVPLSLLLLHDDICFVLLETKLYYTRYMPYVVAQPLVRESIIASLLNKNASDVAAQQEWELEWNQAGLASRLSEEVRPLLVGANIIAMDYYMDSL